MVRCYDCYANALQFDSHLLVDFRFFFFFAFFQAPLVVFTFTH